MLRWAASVDGGSACISSYRKGSLEPGKLADLVILSANPKVEPMAIRDIIVEETFKEGEIVYLR